MAWRLCLRRDLCRGPRQRRPPKPAARFRGLRSRSFRIYFGGQAVSASGTFLQQTAIGWLVFELTRSPSDLGLVLAAGGIPSLLFGPWGGAVADRVDLRKLLIVTQTLFCLLAALLWVLALTGRTSVAALVAIGVAGGVVQIADSPARQAIVSRLVPRDDLASAVSLNGVVVNSARVVGPALAGVLIVTVGTTVCFGLNALSYLVVIAALFVIRPRKAGGPGPPGRRGVKEGLRYAAGRQQLWLPLLMMSVVGLLAFNFAVVLPVCAKDTFHGNGGTYGLLTTMLSVGAVTGSLAVGRIHHPRRQYLLFAAGVRGHLGSHCSSSQRCRGLHHAARHGRGGLLLCHVVFDHSPAAQLERLSQPDHGALGLRLLGDHADRQHRDRRDHRGQWSEGRAPGWLGSLPGCGSAGRLRPHAAEPRCGTHGS